MTVFFCWVENYKIIRFRVGSEGFVRLLLTKSAPTHISLQSKSKYASSGLSRSIVDLIYRLTSGEIEAKRGFIGNKKNEETPFLFFVYLQGKLSNNACRSGWSGSLRLLLTKNPVCSLC